METTTTTPRPRSEALLDEATLLDRRDYFEITDDDLARLRSLKPFFERYLDRIMDRMYEFLVEHRQSRAFLPDEATIRRVRGHQREFFLGFLRGAFDASYIEDRTRLGRTAERIGLPPTLYIGAYAVFMRALQDALHEAFHDPAEANAGFNSFRKLVFLDQALTIETYVAASRETIARQQAAIRELSTPVIQLQDRVLFLPIVGTIDGARADQILATVGARVRDHRARCLVIDVTGVSLMDTHAVRSLIDTAATAKLLGARTIISGLSADVACSVARLGIDTSSVKTVLLLADAIQLALEDARGP